MCARPPMHWESFLLKSLSSLDRWLLTSLTPVICFSHDTSVPLHLFLSVPPDSQNWISVPLKPFEDFKDFKGSFKRISSDAQRQKVETKPCQTACRLRWSWSCENAAFLVLQTWNWTIKRLLHSTFSALLFSTLLCSSLLYPSLLYSTLLYFCSFRATLLHSALPCSSLLYSTLPCSILRFPALFYSFLL